MRNAGLSGRRWCLWCSFRWGAATLCRWLLIIDGSDGSGLTMMLKNMVHLKMDLNRLCCIQSLPTPRGAEQPTPRWSRFFRPGTHHPHTSCFLRTAPRCLFRVASRSAWIGQTIISMTSLDLLVSGAAHNYKHLQKDQNNYSITFPQFQVVRENRKNHP